MAQRQESPGGTANNFSIRLDAATAAALRTDAEAAGMTPERHIVWCVEQHARDQTDLALDETAEWDTGRPRRGPHSN